MLDLTALRAPGGVRDGCRDDADRRHHQPGVDRGADVLDVRAWRSVRVSRATLRAPMTRFDSRSVRRWLWVSGTLMNMLMVKARATPADVAWIVPTERQPELRRRLLVCVIAFIVAFLVGLLPIPFVSSVSPTQRWIELIAPPRNP